MSSAVASSASSTFLLALASASPGGRRWARVSAPPPLRAEASGRLVLRWAPPRRTSRDGGAVVRAEAGAAGKDVSLEKRRNDDAASARQPGARRPGGGGKVLTGDRRLREVVERSDPVPPTGRYGSGDPVRGGETSAPELSQDGPRLASQNGSLRNADNKSIVSAPPMSIVKVPVPGFGVSLPSGDKAPETIFPTTTPPPPPSWTNDGSWDSDPWSDAAVNVEPAEKKGAKVVEGAPKPKTPSPSYPNVHEAPWDFKKYIGFEEPVRMNDDVQAVADDEGSSDSEHYQNYDSGPLAGENVMNVIVVAAECSPWCKTGGLGDVVGALPKALARRGHRVMVIVPRYGDYEEAHDIGIRKYYKAAGQDLEVKYFHAYIDGVDFVFIDAPLFRHRQDDIYGGSRQEIIKRMILFCKAAVEVPWNVPCGGVPYGDGNLVFIANDWHTALLPVYLKAYYRDHGSMQYTRSVLVIHNIAHQGRGPVDEFPYMELPDHYLQHFELYDPVGGEHANIFAAGLKMADQVVTVSRGYLWELKTVEGGWGLHDIIRANDWKMNGIVNGIDMTEWNPEVDVHLQSDGYTNYSLGTLDAGKRQCKAALQRELGLAVRDDVPLIGFIGRLDGQKGVDIIADAMPWIVGQDVQLVMLGAGRADLERTLRNIEAQHKDKVRGWVGFSVPMAHRITAGADVLAMPSRFEPCGLNQLYAMAYGTVPVVHAVGGLRDTVTPFDPFGDSGLGWTFDRAEPHKLIDALGHCLDTYRKYKESWRRLQERGMSQDLSWERAAQLYEDVLVKAKYQW